MTWMGMMVGSMACEEKYGASCLAKGEMVHNSQSVKHRRSA